MSPLDGRLVIIRSRRKRPSSLSWQSGYGLYLWLHHGLYFFKLVLSTLTIRILHSVLKYGQRHMRYGDTYYFIFGNFVICYLLPLGVIFVCYMTIWLRVYQRPLPSNCYQTAMELVHQRSKAAVIKMLFVVVLIFALSWLPLYALIIRLKFGGEPSDTESVVINAMYPVAQWLGCFNSCINPIIYSFLNHKFRKAFLRIFGCNRKKNIINVKHKSPTVNLLLKRLSTIQYRVETTMYDDREDSSDSI